MIDQTPVELAAHTGIDERYGLDLWPEPHLAELAGRAGFTSVRRILDSPPAHTVFELLP